MRDKWSLCPEDEIGDQYSAFFLLTPAWAFLFHSHPFIQPEGEGTSAQRVPCVAQSSLSSCGLGNSVVLFQLDDCSKEVSYDPGEFIHLH